MKSLYSLEDIISHYPVSLNSKLPFSTRLKVVGAGYKLYRSEYKIEIYQIPYIMLENVVTTVRVSFQWYRGRSTYLS